MRPGDVIFPAFDQGADAPPSRDIRDLMEREMPGVRIPMLMWGGRDTLVYRPHRTAAAVRQSADIDQQAQRARAAYTMAAYGVEPGEWADATEGEQRRWRLVAEAVRDGSPT